MKKQVLIKEGAFLNMIVSAAETFKLETYGILLGYRTETGYTVEYAIPLVTPERSPYHIKPNPRREARIKELISSLQLGVEIIGDFHSHTQLKDVKALPIPSPDDIAGMEEGNVYIIIAINEKERDVEWQHNVDDSISGTLENFHLKMRAFEMRGKRQYRSLKVICPVATGIV